MSSEGQSSSQQFHGTTPRCNKKHQDGLNGDKLINKCTLQISKKQQQILLTPTFNIKFRLPSTTEKLCIPGLNSRPTTSTTLQSMEAAILLPLKNAFIKPITITIHTMETFQIAFRELLAKWTTKNLHQINLEMFLNNSWTTLNSQRTTQKFQSRMQLQSSRRNLWTPLKTTCKENKKSDKTS